LERETAVIRLQDELRRGVYAPSPYHTFYIRDPKPRTISAAAFRDRVVHHALCEEIEPDLERGASPHSDACRRGRGSLAALWAAAAQVRRHSYVLKLDIEHFFETLSHEVLLRLLRTALRNESLWELSAAFTHAGAPGSESGRGVPIGNLTSQHFANFYLAPLDRHIVRGLRADGYIRYMNDMLVFGPSAAALWRHAQEIECFVCERLDVRLKARLTRVQPVSDGVSFLGWRLFPGCVRMDGVRRRHFVSRMCRLNPVLDGEREGAETLRASAASSMAWSQWGQSTALRRSLFWRGVRRGLAAGQGAPTA
jgi:hypothetical protein